MVLPRNASRPAQEQPNAVSELTCHKCNVSTISRAAINEHYSSKWHQHNLIELNRGRLPCTLDQYNAWVQQALMMQAGEEATTHKCVLCKKMYNSPEAHLQHTQSKKHKSNVKMYAHNGRQGPVDVEDQSCPQPDALQQNVIQEQEYLTDNEEEWETAPNSDEDCETAPSPDEDCKENASLFSDLSQYSLCDISVKNKKTSRVDIAVICLFCGEVESNFSVNLDHMQDVHGYNLGRMSKAGQQKELIHRLVAERVFVDRKCVSCERQFSSVGDCRSHMRDTRHTALDIDFTDAAPVQLPVDEYTCTLADGKQLVHRDLRAYCSQRLNSKPTSLRDVQRNRQQVSLRQKIRSHERHSRLPLNCVAKYSAENGEENAGPSKEIVAAYDKQAKRLQQRLLAATTVANKCTMRVEVSANKQQPHFRLQYSNAG